MKTFSGPAAWRVLAGLAGLAGIVWAGWWVMMRMPGKSYRGPLLPADAETRALSDVLRADVEHLAGKIGPRHVNRPASYRAAADFIEEALRAAGWEVSRQIFAAQGEPCANLIAEVRGRVRPDEIIVVGAHYDTCGETPGANDNASGVATLLALARHFAGQPPPARTLRWVAFANEEPPFFKSPEMGSLVYARSCRERGEVIVAMLSLETIGYYRDEPGSQRYPFPLAWFYPSRGNFIGFVSRTADRALVRQCVAGFRRHAQFPSEGGALPAALPGIDWSDHWAFWQAGYPALMITDTAPFRYPYYHHEEDTPDKLDFDRLARVVSGLAGVVAELVQPDAARLNPRPRF